MKTRVRLAAIDERGMDDALPTDAADIDDTLCTVDDLVRSYVEGVLAYTKGNKSRAARILGVDESTLYRWRQRWRATDLVRSL